MSGRFRRGGGGAGPAAAEPPAAETRATADRESLRAVRARQREEFGGVNWGAAFFGWLVAIGLGALLVGLLAAAGAAVGVTSISDTDTVGTASKIGIGGAVAPLARVAVAHFCGGCVGAGRVRLLR